MAQESAIRALTPREEPSPFVTRDARFGDVAGEAPRLERVVDTDAHEGPVYVPEEDALSFTTVPRDRAPVTPGPRLPRITRTG